MTVDGLPRAPRRDFPGLLDEVERCQRVFEDWPQQSRAALDSYRAALDALNGEALRRLIRALKEDPAAAAAIRRAAGDEIVYAVLRHHGLIKPSLDERVDAALASIRPALAVDGGDVELVRLVPPAVELRFTGACESCPASSLTLRDLVANAIRSACPEITEILQARSAARLGAG